MKRNRLKSSVIAVITALTLGVSAFAGCTKKDEGRGDSDCNHEVSSWSAIKEPNCVEGGQDRGTCTLCGDVVLRDTAPDPTKHDYGDWVVTKPQDDKEGKAVKTCSRSCTDGHVRTVTLPALTEVAEYKSVNETKKPTAKEDGEKTYVFADSEGDITFTVAVPALNIEDITTLDALVAYLASNGGNVRSASIKARDIGEARDVTCYYGNDYVHLNDPGDNREEWYSLDENGNIYGVRRSLMWVADSDPDRPDYSGYTKEVTEALTDAVKDSMKGYDFAFGRASTRRFYGAEDLLSGMCALATADGAANFSGNELENSADKLTDGDITFTFDYAGNVEYYCEFICTFRFNDAGCISYIKAESKAYADSTKAGEVLYDEYVEYVEMVFKTPDDVVPENEFGTDARYITSFTAKYGNSVLGEEPVEVPVNARLQIELSDIQPATASLEYDPLEVYLRTEDAGDIPLSDEIVPDKHHPEYRIIGIYQSGVVYINSQIKGEVTIVLRTRGGKCEKVFKLDVQPGTPSQSSLRVNYYQYDDAGGTETYNWMEYTNGAKFTGIKVGQKVVFKLGATGEEASYASLAFNPKVVINGTTTEATNVTVTNVPAPDPNDKDALYDSQVVEVTAQAAGTYRLWLFVPGHENDANPLGVSAVLTVEEAPAYSEMLADGATYTGKLLLPAACDVSVTFNNTGDWKNGTVTVTHGGRVTGFTYAFDEQTKSITTAYASGAIEEDEINTYDFTFAINGAFKLVITHPDGGTGFDDKGNEVLTYESRVLEPAVQQQA